MDQEGPVFHISRYITSVDGHRHLHNSPFDLRELIGTYQTWQGPCRLMSGFCRLWPDLWSSATHSQAHRAGEGCCPTRLSLRDLRDSLGGGVCANSKGALTFLLFGAGLDSCSNSSAHRDTYANPYRTVGSHRQRGSDSDANRYRRSNRWTDRALFLVGLFIVAKVAVHESRLASNCAPHRGLGDPGSFAAG